MTKKKETRGGYRENAKRPLKYGEPTVAVMFRVPESKKEAVTNLVKKFLEKFVIN